MSTSTKRANLTQLRDYLELNKDQIQAAEAFDMSLYCTEYVEKYEGCENVPLQRAVECGTCFCLVGYGPLAGIPPLPNQGWSHYVVHNFVDCLYDHTYRWLFNEYWKHVDNTLQGGIDRLTRYLNFGIEDLTDEALTSILYVHNVELYRLALSKVLTQEEIRESIQLGQSFTRSNT